MPRAGYSFAVFGKYTQALRIAAGDHRRNRFGSVCTRLARGNGVLSSSLLVSQSQANRRRPEYAGQVLTVETSPSLIDHAGGDLS